MARIELEYAGGDLVISQETAEKALGLHPGDRIEIRAKEPFAPIKRSAEGSEKILKALRDFRESVEPSDLDQWESSRNELWAKWQIPT